MFNTYINLYNKNKDIKLLKLWYDYKNKSYYINYSTKIDNFYTFYKAKGNYNIKNKYNQFVIIFRKNKEVLCSRYIDLKQEFGIDVMNNV